jgi:hypothetical protein
MKRLCLAVAALLTAVAACSSPAAMPGPSSARARAALEEASATTRVTNVVKVPEGYEAATWSLPASIQHRKRDRPYGLAQGSITFWRSGDSGASWHRVGTSQYLSIYRICQVRVVAHAVQGAPDAVFIAHTCPTGDGDLNAFAYASGPEGWGVVEADGQDRMVSRGRPERWVKQGEFDGYSVGSAVRYELAFKGRELETVDGTGYLSNAGNDAYPRLRLWRWSAGGFVGASDSAFVAEPQPSPDLHATVLPHGACPANGAYAASFGVSFRGLGDHQALPNAPVKLVVFPPADRFPDTYLCTQTIVASTPMTALLAHSPKPYSVHATLSRFTWMTAPVWMILTGDFGFTGRRLPLLVGTGAQRSSPYVVPSRFGDNVMLARFGSTAPSAKSKKRNNGRPTNGTVTFRDGRIVALAVRP